MHLIVCRRIFATLSSCPLKDKSQKCLVNKFPLYNDIRMCGFQLSRHHIDIFRFFYKNNLKHLEGKKNYHSPYSQNVHHSTEAKYGLVLQQNVVSGSNMNKCSKLEIVVQIRLPLKTIVILYHFKF